MVSNVSAFAEESINETDVSLGCISETQEEIEAFFGEPKTFVTTRATLPSSVDLSKDVCFPLIGDQKNLGACSSFATTYYQFTYEVNKMNGVNNKNNIVMYSPKWTYNLCNSGLNEGSEITDNYSVLMDLGCLKSADLPYTGVDNPVFYRNIPEYMESEKREALSTRIDSCDRYVIPNTASISSPSSSALNDIKTALNQGKVLTSETPCDFNSVYTNGNCIVYRCTQQNFDTHAVAIVGYDDNISYDVNQNGIIESCEKGALKIANSWGKTYNQNGISSISSDENAGYFWVLYDALNRVSVNTINNWEGNLAGPRYPAFSTSNISSDVSNFYSINVANKKVTLVGELDINTTDLYGCELQINRTADSVTSWQTANAKIVGNFKQSYRYDENGFLLNQNIGYSGKILFDYSSFDEPISQYISGYNWHIRSNDIVPGKNISSLRITDNKGKIVTAYSHLTGNSSVKTTYRNVSLKRGDIDYDGSVTISDSSLLMNYVSMIIKLSDLQMELADYNRDGDVNIADVIAINSSLWSTATVSELKEINALNEKVNEFVSIYGIGGNLNEIN